MKAKEAIEFCKNESSYNYNGQNKELQNRLRLFNFGLEQVVTLLQRGEKFEKMWEEVENLSIVNIYTWVTKEYYTKAIKVIKQKYFPKEAINDNSRI